ncbi:CBS domain-containing protein [Streptomyces sp. RB6PN25]|uniref:CBS domain-containing protein n=1 Tax=Streptomyces humicola TaxID=2953240 RepID=A0ABT1PNR5_9ACTN|nr:CBS domain-containing protein [Streptomyces humicola]MCQ4079314.1 CBS domain-containing protein [Streptomyces humicola]
MPQTVQEIMTTAPVKVGVQTSIAQVARRMRDEDIGAVLVADDNALRGLVTDRDLVVRAPADGKNPEQTTVTDVCSSQVVTISPDHAVSTAVELMRKHSLRRLPVVRGGQPVGILSLGDLAIERDEHCALADIIAAEPNT